MNSLVFRERKLQELLEENFLAAKHCRSLLPLLDDASLKHYFQNLASRHSQFAIELGEEIAFYSGKEPYIPSSAYDRRKKERENLNSKDFSLQKALKSFLKLQKKRFLAYSKALAEINDGNSREILLRHKAYLENTLFELKGLKVILKYSKKAQKNSPQDFFSMNKS